MASLTLSLTDTLIGGRQTIQQVIVSGFPFFFALPPPRKKRKPDHRLSPPPPRVLRTDGRTDVRTYGRPDGRTDGHVTITSQPKFLGLIGYQISLAMELRWRALPAGSAKIHYHICIIANMPPIDISVLAVCRTFVT